MCECRPLIPERMPVLIDDDLRFEDGPGAPRPAVVVNRWLRELPASGCAGAELVGELRAGGQGVDGVPGRARGRAVRLAASG